MTQEDKLEQARELYKTANEDQKCILEKLFPELKESEDERIRKALITFFQRFPYDSIEKAGTNAKEALAWLEKQKPIDPDTLIVAEQKPTDTKFKVRDWVVSDYNNVAYIESISETKYNLQCKDGHHEKMSIDYVDKCWRKWDISDAKPGDVLSDGTTIFIFKDLLSDGSVMSYCDYDTENDAFCSLSMNLVCSKITPATKEQRGQLEKAMADAGYTFDFEKKKKELKKIEQKCSEEDNVRLQRIIDFLWHNRKGDTDTIYQQEQDIDWLKSLKDKIQPKQEWSEEDEKILGILIDGFEDYSEPDAEWWKGLKVKECTNWFKSLKDRYTWKPSDEQMNILKELMEDNDQRHFYTILKSLYQDLKKL